MLKLKRDVLGEVRDDGEDPSDAFCALLRELERIGTDEAYSSLPGRLLECTEDLEIHTSNFA